MAWLYTLFILMLAQVLRSVYTTDNVTVQLQLNSYQYKGREFTCQSPLFRIRVDAVIGVCEEDFHYKTDEDFKEFNGTPSQNSTAPSSPVIQYTGGNMVYLIPRQAYSKALHLIVKQKFNNKNISPGVDDAAYYCSNVTTDDLVSPFNLTLQSQDCSACSIDVTMVAKCPQNYFNAQCNVYCLPSDDDTYGHYTCGHEGEKICLPGYDGENCTINIPDCVNVTCHNGTCNDLVANFSCSCYSGYTGEFCEHNIDDCVEDACENGGKCVDGIGYYTCSCTKGFDGLHCEHNIDDCVKNACQHGGTCHDGIANYTCYCANGFNGLHCEHNIDDCVKNACQHGGTCYDGIANYTCSCANGFDGLHCEHNIDDCVKTACQHEGTCHDGIANYTCSCVDGFDGLQCEHNIDDCVNITCQNGGTCHDGVRNYTCSCVNGFVGIKCQLHITAHSTTSQPKVLISEYNTDHVTLHLQLNSYKYNGGVVKFKSPLFKILVDEVIGVCEEDYFTKNNRDFKTFNGTPTQNSTAPSAPVIQYSGGKMVYLIPRQTYSKALHLIVKQKYKNRNIVPGEDDTTYYCSNVATDDLVSPFNLTLQSQDCSACSIDVTMVAKCPQNYFNAQCNVYCLPSDDDTSGHYTCGHEGEKICLLGYHGENCTINIPDCVNVTCHNGTCIDHVANFSCSCYSGYTGEFCEHNIDDCVEDACENGGRCVDGIGNYTCSCTKGFDGLHCEHNIDDCVKNACQHGGTCYDGIGNYTCSCANGFDGLHCEHNIDDCVKTACQHGGTCHDGIANYTCSCVDGFDGLQCEHNIDDCVNITCQNGGRCHDGIRNYTCSCVDGFDGLQCEHNIDDCVNITCQNGGRCHDGIRNYTCSCVNGFVGIKCQLHITAHSTTSQPKVLISEYNTDHVTLHLQLNSYKYNGGEFEFKSPLFRILVDAVIGVCEEDYYPRFDGEFKEFNGTPTQNSTSPSSPVIQYSGGKMVYLIPRQAYNKALHLIVKQKYKNRNILPGEDDATYYCSNVTTDDLVSPFNLTLQSQDCSACSIDVTMVAKCPQHYFNAQCNVYCLPSDDDTYGHYTCGHKGEKICLPGYHGENCTINIPDCVNVTCHNGTCIDHGREVLRSEYNTDPVTLHLQLNSYKYKGGEVKFKSPLFTILVDEVIGDCEEDYHHRNDGDFKQFNGTPTQNATAPSDPVIHYSGGKMVYLIPRQTYSKALHLIVKQKFKNKNILPGEDDTTYYCSNVTTDDLVSPFNLTLQSQDCSACSINVTMVAKCPQHYFNAQCNVYCLPSDDDTRVK